MELASQKNGEENSAGLANLGGDCCGAACVYCERFSGYRAYVPCCTIEMCLISVIQTGRCGRIFFFNLVVVE